ncbi:Fe-S cluster assembly sulfur transfer protein SufU [Glutamicibacter nicotianae]|uniref:Iron-sulfur cluster assembly scaffold protein NifU n=1 Tax=Glutamicibacter nicotianae TaxID=37929 RepID=A0ABQ0RQ91_GLUNI|nr:SUF system NifU family Fe-S cluster assembly protein [Glutamicibacter nicotianae]GEC13979.1 iron-sulfur cluster assembly scaffold protein NifU [Glutamicibacter nicotianae]
MNELDQLYQQVILDHSKRRIGSPLVELTEGLLHGESHQHNPICGDQIRVRVELDDQDHFTSMSWEGDGCSISMASASVLAEMLPELTKEEFLGKRDYFREMMRSKGNFEPDEDVLEDAAAFVGVSKFPARVKCAMLAWVAAEVAMHEAHK